MSVATRQLALLADGSVVRVGPLVKVIFWGESVFEVEDAQGFRRDLPASALTLASFEMFNNSLTLPGGGL